MRRRTQLVGVVAVLGLLAGGCTGSDDEATAQRAVDVLAQKLHDHTLAGVTLADASVRTLFDQQVAGMKSYPVEVEAADVKTDGDRTRSPPT
jgi:hypothetical protein